MIEKAKAVLACAVLVACGSSTDPSPSSSSSPTPGTLPGETPAEQTPSEPPREGNVTVHTTGDTITAGAEFGPKYPAGVPLTEGCTLIDDSNAGTQGESDSAGIIDVDVVLAGEPNALEIEFNAERKNYQYFSLPANGHASGTIRVRAHGGLVPAFEAEIAALPPTQLSSPAQGAAIGARDLPVSWTFDGEDRHSIVYLSTLGKDVRCYVPKGRETVIPAALVGEILANEGDVRLFVLTAKTTQVDAGDYRISLSHNSSTWVDLTRE